MSTSRAPEDEREPVANATAVRTRGAAALQASRLLARHLLALPGALDQAARGEDGVLIAALQPERSLPPSFARLSTAIAEGGWGEGLDELGDAFGCDGVARDLLGLLLAPELDAEVGLLFERTLGRDALSGLSLDLLRRILDPLGERPGEIADALDADAPLRRYLLVEAEDKNGRAVFRAAPRLARHLFDLPARFLDEAARDGMRLARVDDAERQRFAPLVDPALDVMRRFPFASHRLLSGPPGVGQEQAAAQLAADYALDLLVADLPVLLGPRSPVQALSLLLREARLCRAVPLLLGVDALFEARVGPSERAAALRHLGFERGPVFYASSKRLPELSSWLRSRNQPEAIELATPDAEVRAGLWLRELPDVDEPDREFVSQAFALSPDGIRRAARAALHRAQARGDEAPSRALLEAACRDETTHALHNLSARVTVRVDWREVVLPDETRATLREIVATALHRKKVYEGWGFRRHLPSGAGLSVMFSGEPGTGKTLVAGLIARDLGVELYRVDLSRIVSKYVGETEKQLGQIFDEAEAARVALLFDEADSLFSKRTEVKSSVDRYANLEVNYLLQKMEEFDGLTILTTNFKKSIDEAFLRRIRYRVEFPFPEVEERARIWEALLPGEALVDGPLDFLDLAERFKMTGGHIRNALVRAAFLAAADDSAITQSHLEQGATAEYREMGRLMTG